MKTIKCLVVNFLQKLGYQIRRVATEDNVESSLGLREWQKPPYIERKEVGASNLCEKNKRLAEGLPFEWPDILNLNKAVALIVGDSSTVVELGSGTGAFAIEISKDPTKTIVASEFDFEAYEWAVVHRSHPNIKYVNRPVDVSEGPFDLCVAIEVIEHIEDFRSFIKICSSLAPRCIFTTPNRLRNASTAHSGPPDYFQHVREWSAGEFYWVLRSFYRNVKLYALESQTDPASIPINVDSHLSPLIADCSDPY